MGRCCAMKMYITVEDKCYLVRVKFARESFGVVETVQDMLQKKYLQQREALPLSERMYYFSYRFVKVFNRERNWTFNAVKVVVNP